MILCGHVGMAGKVNFKEEKAFKNLLILDSLRGEHSTGIAAVTKEKEILIAKAVGDPFTLFDTKPCEALFKRVNRVLIGHNRFATTGKINKRNAHPFEFDTLVGAHNGTLTNKHNLTDAALYDVDSEALFHNIEKHGTEEAIGKAQGAWALVWWNKEKESLNILRNSERTLYYTWSEDGKTIFWASESWMLNVALTRNDIKYDKIVMFEQDKHYEFKMDLSKEEINQPTVKTCLGKKEDFFPKKAGGSVVSYLGTTASIDEKYLGVSHPFKIVAHSKDEHGADFLILNDTSDEGKLVRLYLHKQDHLKQKIGYLFNGTVKAARRSSSGLIIYRVEINGPLYQQKAQAAIINLSAAKIPEKKKEIKDQKGNIISERDLKDSYESCGWCNQVIDHSQEGHLYMSREHGAICKDCVDLPEVKLFAN